jgi:hypothetical protein
MHKAVAAHAQLTARQQQPDRLALLHPIHGAAAGFGPAPADVSMAIRPSLHLSIQPSAVSCTLLKSPRVGSYVGRATPNMTLRYLVATSVNSA